MDNLQNIQPPAECPFCRGALATITEKVAVPNGKKTVLVEHTHPKCVSCNEILLDPADLDYLQTKAANQMREELGLLAPSEIKRIRKELGLSQNLLERILAAAPKSITRWERGTVCQSGAADSVLRVFASSPEMVAVLAVQRGLGIPASPRIKFAYSRHLAQSVSRGTNRFDSEVRITTTAPKEPPVSPSAYSPFPDRLVKVAGR